MYTYQAYGQTIAASFPLPELRPAGELAASASGSRDIIIREGETPPELEEPLGEGVLYQAKADSFLLKLDSVAHYLVQNGTEIVVRPMPGSRDADVRLFLLGSCMGALLHQQGILALHASAIQVGEGAVLFLGPSSSGKSTLLGAFLKRGYRMLADDITGLVAGEQNRVLALPAVPCLHLWADALEELGHDRERLEQARPGLQKYLVDTRAFFCHDSLPISRIYHLTPHNKEDIELLPLSKITGFQTILFNTYHQRFLDGLDMRAPHFLLSRAATRQASILKVLRPLSPFRLEKLADLIEADFSGDSSHEDEP